MMRILGLDHGSKRMGVAISDELKTIAQPLEFIRAEPLRGVFERLEEIIAEKTVELIVVGMPRNMDGSYGPSAEKVRDFVARLGEAVAVPVRVWDERLTSVQANRFLREANVRGKRQRQKVDQTAAALLLQSYLDAVG